MTNEQISKQDYVEMEKTIHQTIAKLQRALSYGEDMRSSRLSCMEQSKAWLSAFISDLSEKQLQS